MALPARSRSGDHRISTLFVAVPPECTSDKYAFSDAHGPAMEIAKRMAETLGLSGPEVSIVEDEPALSPIKFHASHPEFSIPGNDDNVFLHYRIFQDAVAVRCGYREDCTGERKLATGSTGSTRNEAAQSRQGLVNAGLDYSTIDSFMPKKREQALNDAAHDAKALSVCLSLKRLIQQSLEDLDSESYGSERQSYEVRRIIIGIKLAFKWLTAVDLDSSNSILAIHLKNRRFSSSQGFYAASPADILLR